MSVDIEQAIRDGASRTVKRNGLLFVGILSILSFLNAMVGFGMARWALNRGFGSGMMPGRFGMMAPTLPLSPIFGGLLSLLLWIAFIVVAIAAIRTFVSDETETIPPEHYQRNMVGAGLNFIVGGIVFGIIVGIGTVFLVLPGIFLLVTLVFWTVYVAVEDTSFLEGFRESWALTSAHRLSLFLLGVGVLLISVIVNAVFGVGMVAGAVGVLVAQAGSALTTVFSLATLAAAYNQLVSQPIEAEEISEQVSSVDEGSADPV